MSFLIWTFLLLLNVVMSLYRRYHFYRVHDPDNRIGANTLLEKLGLQAIRRRPSFMELPAEIRLQIYDIVLVSPHTLRRPIELANRPHVSTLNTALLRTSRLIHNDALPTLYTRNHFHISLVSPLRLPSSPLFFTAHSSYLTTLSIDYALPSPSPTQPRRSLARQRHIDAILADELTNLADACPTLRVFALNLLSPPGEPDDILLALALDNALTPAALRHLHVRDRIVITAVGSGPWLRSGNAYGPLRRAVAPLEMWHTATCRMWPTVRTSVEGYEGDRRWARTWILLMPMRGRTRTREEGAFWEKRGFEGGGWV